MWSKLKLALRIILPILAVCGGIYGVLAYRYWSNPPKLTHNYAAELNAPILKFPEDQRAWPIYREAMIELDRDAPKSWLTGGFPQVADDGPSIKHLRSRSAALDNARRAGELPCFGFLLSDVYSPEDSRLQGSIDHELPWVKRPPSPTTPSDNPRMTDLKFMPGGKMKRLSYCLQIDALIAAREGDGERTTADLIAIMRMAHHCRETPFAVNDAFCVSRLTEALFAWGWLMEKYPTAFNEDRLLRLERAAAQVGGGGLSPRFIGDRMVFYDVVQRLYTDEGDGDGWLWVYGKNLLLDDEKRTANLGERFMEPFAARYFPSRRQIVEEFDRMAELAEHQAARPYWEADFREYKLQEKSFENERYKLLDMYLLAPQSLHRSMENLIQKRDAIVAVSALHRFRLASGKWPTTLADCVPEYFEEVPIDRHNGKPLGFRITNKGPFLYSVGDDNDDDKGRVAFDREARPWFDHRVKKEVISRRPHFWDTMQESPPPDGDLILWPVTPPDDAAPLAPLEP